MSTSVLYHAFQIEGVKCNSTSFEGQNIIFQAEIADSHIHCPNCKSDDIIFKDHRERRFHLPPMGRKQCFLNLLGFCKGVPSEAFAEINWYMDRRMRNFLERRSQRGYKQSQGDGGWYAHLRKLGLRVLSKARFM